MNTTSLNDLQNIKKKFQELLTEKTEKEGIKHDELILMSFYLSEIERIQMEKKIRRNKLAELIAVSASYLTQVFRGNKPLNFHTIAKIQRVLDIKFSIRAHHKNDFLLENIDLAKYRNKPMASNWEMYSLKGVNSLSISSSGILSTEGAIERRTYGRK